MKAGQPDDIRRWLWQPQLHLIDCESGKASYSCRCIKSGKQLKTMIMKTIKFIILTLLVSMVSFAMAQKKITINDTYDGKTIVQIAKDHAVEAFIATKAFYKDGMTEEAFVNACFINFPSKYNDLRDVFMPYASHLYYFHKKGLTEEQVRKQTTGKEYVDCANELITWKQAHPGEEIEGLPWWRKTIHWIAIFFTWLDSVL